MVRCWHCGDEGSRRNSPRLEVRNFPVKLKMIVKNENNQFKVFAETNRDRKKSNNSWIAIPSHLSRESSFQLKEYRNELLKLRSMKSREAVRRETSMKKQGKTMWPPPVRQWKLNESLNVSPPRELTFDSFHGLFCSFPCAWTHIRNMDASRSHKTDCNHCIATLIQNSFRIGIGNTNQSVPPILKIKPCFAPPFGKLSDYGGNMSRSDYRKDIRKRMENQINSWLKVPSINENKNKNCNVVVGKKHLQKCCSGIQIVKDGLKHERSEKKTKKSKPRVQKKRKMAVTTTVSSSKNKKEKIHNINDFM